MCLENESFVKTNKNIIDEAEANETVNDIILSPQRNEIENIKSLNFGKFIYIILTKSRRVINLLYSSCTDFTYLDRVRLKI